MTLLSVCVQSKAQALEIEPYGSLRPILDLQTGLFSLLWYFALF